ncbi:MAG: hypothetical protein HYS25_13855 [Ignavibacteriales bacterium]|nr:hypothetical protein [Ignavibacteriales bacterium]
MKRKFVLTHYKWGCSTMLSVLILLLVTSFTIALPREQFQHKKNEVCPADSGTSEIDSTVVKKEELIIQYKAEIDKMQKAFEGIYLQIASTDPQTVQRMSQLLDVNSQAVALLTAIKLYQKEIENLSPKKPEVMKKE